MVHTPLLRPVKVSGGAVGSMAAACKALDIHPTELQAALRLSADDRYIRKITPKKDGSDRVVYNPNYLIRKIQRRINRRFFSNPSVIQWPDHVFGSIPNSDDYSSPAAVKDYVNCARQHCGAKSVLSVDIQSFFDNIHQDQVENIFVDFLRFDASVARAFADICCRAGSVVQGALTSSYIASLCLYDSEGEIVRRLTQKGLIYTRFVDDITVSSKVMSYDFAHALRQIEGMLANANLPLNTNKTRVQYASMSPLLVHGLRVDFSEPRLPPKEPGQIRAAVKNLELLAASPGYRASRAYRKDFNRCMGRVNKLQRVGHSLHGALLKRMRSILPLPSHKDLERAERLISRLERDYMKSGYSSTYWYYRRFFVAKERLGILGRSFERAAQAFQLRLNAIRPLYKDA